MKKYLMRSGLHPLEYKTPGDLIDRDFIGTNSGNMLYAYAIFRNLVSPDVTIESDEYVVSMSKVDDINTNYDGYIIALADAIRPDFMPTLSTNKCYSGFENTSLSYWYGGKSRLWCCRIRFTF